MEKQTRLKMQFCPNNVSILHQELALSPSKIDPKYLNILESESIEIIMKYRSAVHFLNPGSSTTVL